MPSSDKHEKINNVLGTLGALALFGMGLAMTIFSIWTFKQDEFTTLNNIVRADSTEGEEWQPCPKHFMVAFLVFGIILMLGALLGCIGTCAEMGELMCPYFFFAIIASLGLLIVLAMNISFSNSLETVVQRQAASYCKPNLYPLYKAALGCQGSVDTPADNLTGCGRECQKRVELLKEMRGCVTLNHMCHDFDVSNFGAGVCKVGEGAGQFPTTYAGGGAGMNQSACSNVCLDHGACSGFNFCTSATVTTCAIVSQEVPTSPLGAPWRLVFDETNQTTITVVDPAAQPAFPGQSCSCFKKGVPKFVDWGHWLSKSVTGYSTAFLIVTILITCCSCSLLFSLTTRRKGKKGAFAVCQRMLCPCCIPQYESRLPSKRGQLDESDEDYDSDDYVE